MRVALIPARSGSKGVPRKNLQKINGLTLVEHAINVAVDSQEFDRVIVSTDGLEIANSLLDFEMHHMFSVLPENGMLTASKNLYIHKRSLVDASDNAKTHQTVQSLHGFGILNLDDSVMLLQPTSPFRDIEELRSILSIFEKSKSGIASVVKITNSHPLKTFQISENRIVNYEQVSDLLNSPRQRLPELFKLDGAYYLQFVSSVLKNQSFLSDETYLFQREGNKTINIDSLEELRFAQALEGEF